VTASCLPCLSLVSLSLSATVEAKLSWTFWDSWSRIRTCSSFQLSSCPTIWAPALNCHLNFSSSWAMVRTLAGRELKDRCRASRLSLSVGSNRPRILSRRSISPDMTKSRVWARLFEPLCRLLRCLTKKPIPRLGDRGAGPPECDRASRVLSVSTLGAVSWDNSSCPSPSGGSSDRHSMASGTLGSEALLVVSTRKLIFCFLPRLSVSQNTDLSVDRPLGTGCTKWSLTSPRVCGRQSFHRTGIGIVR